MTKLELARRLRGLTLKQLGAVAHVNIPDICRIENGEKAYPAHRRRLAEALGVEVGDLFDADGFAFEIDSEAVVEALFGRRTA